MKKVKTATLVPTYKRPEYTEQCLNALKSEPTDVIEVCKDSLREAIITFFDLTEGKYDYIFKIDNDCLVPPGYIVEMLKIFNTSDVDILSPNVFPSNAAEKHGQYVPGMKYMPAETIGGLWSMRRDLINGMIFEHYDVKGVIGAVSILRQIQSEKDVKVGWTRDVVVQDMGHWSGQHPKHIKSADHYEYSHEIGRKISWTA